MCLIAILTVLDVFIGAAFFCNKFFSRFHYSKKAPELVSFGMEFIAFTEFLSALINNDLASLKIVYYGDHRPIAYILRQRDNVIDQNATLSDFEDDDDETQQQNRPNKEIVTEYVIRTKHSINPIDFTSINSPRASVVMMDSHELIEIISDIDKTTDEIQFKIDERAFVVRTLGIIQCNTQIPFPSNHKIFKKFEHHKDTTFSYKFNCFKSMLKALANSVEVCVETKENGLLKIQIMGKSTDVIGSLYYEFSIMPNVSEEDVDIEII